ncbi:MAG: PDGLE domain-containing protein [Sedimentisphaerales bacterium]|nr:PDGLE domain-containing protein [Sedimentisphaerales bacterium]
MALVPSYPGYFLYRTITNGRFSSLKVYIGAMLACVIVTEAGAILVAIQAALSGVLAVPFSTFLIAMTGVHFLMGFIEGLVTVAVLAYLQQLRPDIVADSLPRTVRLSKNAVLATLLFPAVLAGAGLSLLASDLPDGLEWSYAERPDQPGFQTIVSNPDTRITAVDDLQSKYSLMPDYSARASKPGNVSGTQTHAGAGWTSFAGIFGSVVTMAVIWLTAWMLRRKQAS